MTFLNVVFFATAIVQQHGTPYQLNQEANALLAQGRNAEALVMARAAAHEAEATFGSHHPATAMMIRNLAVAHERNGSYLLAEAEARRSLAILESAFGPNDVSLVPALNVLAEAYAGEGQLNEALRTALRSVEIGPDAEVHYGTALHDAGAILELQGRLVEAGQYYRKALAVRQAALPAGHSFTDNTRASLQRVEHAAQLALSK